MTLAARYPLPVPAAAHASSSATVEDLLSPALAGDRDATERLLLLVLPRVRNLVRCLLGGDADVDDVAQESLSIVYRRLGTYRGDGTFTAWVDRIAVRSALGHRRRASLRRESPWVDGEDAVSPGAQVDYASRRRLVETLDALPLGQRDALVMHHVLGMSVPEIAAELAVPDETVRSRLRLGRARMRASLDPRGEVTRDDE